MNEVTFIFKGSREEKKEESSDYPKEFYYGYANLSNRYIQKQLLNLDQNYSLPIYEIFDKFVIKVTNFPIRIFQILKKENIKLLKKSNSIVCINETVAFSTLFIFKFLNLKFKNKKYIFVSMGFMAKIKTINKTTYFQKYLIKSIFETYSKIVFIGKPEYKYAFKNYPEYTDKYVYIPFCIDTNFWKPNSAIKKKYITFIGNDYNRDPYKVLKIAQKMPDLNFLLVTNLINNNAGIENVKVINSDFHNKILDDIEIRKVYDESKLIILPIKDTLQPVGQSVSLQSMSMGVPVVITNTSGFWDSENFVNNKNIILVNDNKTEDWVENISKLLSDQNFYESISAKAKKTVNENFKIEIFVKEIEKFI